MPWPPVKVLTAIARCRTAARGGHRDPCLRCGYPAISYHSCRNRHGPQCQTNAREKWLRRRQQELLPVGYYPLVCSVPHWLVPLLWQNQKVRFTLLFEARAATWREVAADRKHRGAQIGFRSLRHTGGQTWQRHPPVHCVVPGGGLSPDHARWIASRSHFFLPVKVLSRVFRGQFVARLRRAFLRQRLAFHGECLPLANEKAFAAFRRTLLRQDGVVYAKPPFGGPEPVRQYLARYTHRVAISNHRILPVNDSPVSFRRKQGRYASLTARRNQVSFVLLAWPSARPTPSVCAPSNSAAISPSMLQCSRLLSLCGSNFPPALASARSLFPRIRHTRAFENP